MDSYQLKYHSQSPALDMFLTLCASSRLNFTFHRNELLRSAPAVLLIFWSLRTSGYNMFLLAAWKHNSGVEGSGRSHGYLHGYLCYLAVWHKSSHSLGSIRQ